jgi:ATP-dependent exoDNAse (exonuclease V) alpha subunit
MIELTSEQKASAEACLRTLRLAGEAVLAGAAGTGKTTVTRWIADAWQEQGRVLALAPTGKAAVRLAEVLGHAQTIHSTIYGFVDEVTDEKKSKLTFGEVRVPEGADASTLVIIDEASMVNEALAEDVREAFGQVGSRILWIGDHEQLPPVEGSWGADLTKPTACLTTVHRQALESDVLAFATAIRAGTPGLFTRWGGDVSHYSIQTPRALAPWLAEDKGRIVLSYTNAVRTSLNREFRQIHGWEDRGLVAGERIICTYNHKQLGVMNGEVFTVTLATPCDALTRLLETPVYEAYLASGDVRHRVYVTPAAFDKAPKGVSDNAHYRAVWRPLWLRRYDPEYASVLARTGWSEEDLHTWRARVQSKAIQATYAYAITIHKAQGSQFKHVGLVSCSHLRRMQDGDLQRRLYYTAATRAVETLTVFTHGP